MKKVGVVTLCVLGFMGVAFADCSTPAPQVLKNISMRFYSHSLGVYNIFLAGTLNAIENGQADQNGDAPPYYEKTWRGKCPAGLPGSKNSCNEYTVYPTMKNFVNVSVNTPPQNNIMWQIEQYTGGTPNRGEVRIITDNNEDCFVYTTDHESAFSQTYAVPGGDKK